MQQIINFIIRNKTFLLYLLLLLISLLFTFQSHSYHKSKFINSANFLSGGIYDWSDNISEYFNLEEQNLALQEENKRLRSLLFNSEDNKNTIPIDSINETFKVSAGKIIRNSYSSSKNILLINKGENDSIQQDYGVISSKGLIGIVESTNSKYATVLSILNTTSRISAQLKKTNHFGTLSWNGHSPQQIQLTEIPKIAPLKKGDTIITSGRSTIFPKGILIGTIDDFKLDDAQDFYEININLFNDMTSLEQVYSIKNNDADDLKKLLESND
jgi:rod shape-determining protein MreC